MSQITIPWSPKDAAVLSGYRAKAMRWLFVLGVAQVVFAAAAFVGGNLNNASQFNDWRVLVTYALFLGPLAGGATMLLGVAAIAVYRQIGAILTAGYTAFAIFIGSILGIGFVVWGYGALSDYMQYIIGTHEGALLSSADIYDAISKTVPVPLLAYLLWPLQFSVVRDIVAMSGLLGFISLAPGFGIWWERKVAARMQSRIGPMRVGGWHGWAQSPADGIKLVFKEDLIPASGDPILFRLAPYFVVVPTVIAFLALPFGAAWVVRDMDVALIFILAMLGLDVLGVILAGLASNNKYSTYGALREACQMVSYEIPMGMSLLIPVMVAGSLKLSTIADAQAGGLQNWFVFENLWCFAAFIMYYIASLASCKRAPFDLPEAESELVAGFLTEYSGIRWSLFFFAEYAAMFAVSGLAVILFLGGWHSPLPPEWAPQGNGFFAQLINGLLFEGPILFILKSTALFFVQLWIRWTLPRLRIDQVLYACVQVLLPLGMLVLLGNTLWILGVQHYQWPWLVAIDTVLRWVLVGIGLIVALGCLWLAAYGFVHRRRLVGRLGVDSLPGA